MPKTAIEIYSEELLKKQEIYNNKNNTVNKTRLYEKIPYVNKNYVREINKHI